MKLSEIRATLKEIGVSPAKALGQNFLHDQNLARWIVDQAQITSDRLRGRDRARLGRVNQISS